MHAETLHLYVEQVGSWMVYLIFVFRIYVLFCDASCITPLLYHPYYKNGGLDILSCGASSGVDLKQNVW